MGTLFLSNTVLNNLEIAISDRPSIWKNFERSHPDQSLVNYDCSHLGDEAIAFLPSQILKLIEAIGLNIQMR